MSFPTFSTQLSTDSVEASTSLDVYYTLSPSSTEAGDNLGFGIPDTQLYKRVIHYSFGILLIIIGIAGIFGNGLVIYVFTRYRRLRGGGGRLVLSLATGDFMVSILHFMPAYSSFREDWAFGNIGCEIYASMVGLGGMASLLTLAVIAADRFSVIMGSPYPWMSGKKMCLCIWLFCSLLVFPPFVGWSRYKREGLDTSCSWDYSTRTWNNRSYYIFLLFFGFVIPVSVIVVSYIGILRVVCKHSSKMNGVTRNGIIHNKKKPTKSDIRTAQVIFTIIICFLVSWTPYATVSLIGQFGDTSFLSPLNSALPAIFAKASVIYNPIVYGLSHPHFRSVIRAMRARRFPGNSYNNSPHDNVHYQFRRHGKRFVGKAPLYRSGGNDDRSVSHNRDSREGGIFRQPTSDPGTTYRTYESTRSISEEVRVNENGWIVLRKTGQRGGSDVTGRSIVGTDDLSSYDLDVESNTYSEPDLLRCDDRVVKMSENMTMVQYRRHKKDFLRKSFFRSENCLDELISLKGGGGSSSTSGTTFNPAGIVVYYEAPRNHNRPGFCKSVIRNKSKTPRSSYSHTPSPKRNSSFRNINSPNARVVRPYFHPSNDSYRYDQSLSGGERTSTGSASTSIRASDSANCATRRNYALGKKSTPPHPTPLKYYTDSEKRTWKNYENIFARLDARKKIPKSQQAYFSPPPFTMRGNFVSSSILNIRRRGKQELHGLRRMGGLRRKSKADSLQQDKNSTASNPRLFHSFQDVAASRSTFLASENPPPPNPISSICVEIMESFEDPSEYLDPMTDFPPNLATNNRRHSRHDPKRLSVVDNMENSNSGVESDIFYSCN